MDSSDFHCCVSWLDHSIGTGHRSRASQITPTLALSFILSDLMRGLRASLPKRTLVSLTIFRCDCWTPPYSQVFKLRRNKGPLVELLQRASKLPSHDHTTHSSGDVMFMNCAHERQARGVAPFPLPPVCQKRISSGCLCHRRAQPTSIFRLLLLDVRLVPCSGRVRQRRRAVRLNGRRTVRPSLEEHLCMRGPSICMRRQSMAWRVR
jgi:hypothetical protein